MSANSTQMMQLEIDSLYMRVAEYKQRAEAAEAKLRESEMQEPVAYLKPSGETRLAIPCPLDWFSKEIPLYAQLFPKQEDK